MKEKGEISDSVEIQKGTRECQEQLFFNEQDSLKGMDKFLETYSPPKLNQEEINNLNRQIIRSEMESVI